MNHTFADWDIMRCMQIVTHGPEQTSALAVRIGRALRGGESIELVSDLGGGKTTFTQGLAKGLDIMDVVSSPTFTVSREYEGRLRLHHFDFYRLSDAGVTGDEFAEALADTKGVVVVEWADVVRGILPEAHIQIEILAKSETERQLTLHIPEEYSYIAEAIA
jgi:tRNA threonylcarbamoyladenosine biosynthesis protein TsaE